MGRVITVKIYVEITVLHGRVGVVGILGDCGSPDSGSIPGPGPPLQCMNKHVSTDAGLGEYDLKSGTVEWIFENRSSLLKHIVLYGKI